MSHCQGQVLTRPPLGHTHHLLDLHLCYFKTRSTASFWYTLPVFPSFGGQPSPACSNLLPPAPPHPTDSTSSPTDTQPLIPLLSSFQGRSNLQFSSPVPLNTPCCHTDLPVLLPQRPIPSANSCLFITSRHGLPPHTKLPSQLSSVFQFSCLALAYLCTISPNC